MDEYTKKMIMGQSRHLFIYGQDGKERDDFLRSLEGMYPVKVDEKSPMAIYMQDYSLPILPKDKVSGNDSIMLSSLAKDHLDFAIAENILRRINDDVSPEILNARIRVFLDDVNRILLNRRHAKIESLDELLSVAKEGKRFYERYYLSILNGVEKPDVEELKICIMRLDFLIIKLRRILKNDSYFGIIIDHQGAFPIEMTSAVNSIVYRRCNADISMKVATSPGCWETYRTSEGEFVQETHDYGTVELDDSLKTFTLKQKRQMGFDD